MEVQMASEILQWGLSKLDAFLTGLAAVLGVGGGLTLIVLVLRYVASRVVQERIKHYYEVLRLKLKEDYERDRLQLAHKQKMIETMVTELHEFSKTYYMPYLTSIGMFDFYLERGDLRMAFYGVARYFAARAKMVENLPGYFLKDVTAERIVAHLDFKLRRECLDCKSGGFLRHGDVDVLAAIFKPDWGLSLLDFIPRVTGDPNTNEIYERFKAWSGDETKSRNAIRTARTLKEVFTLEINLPYEGWYATLPSHIRQENFGFLEGLAQELITGKDREMTSTEWEDYMEKIRRFVIP